MIPVPEAVRNDELADWIELSCLKGRRGHLSRSDAQDQLRDYSVADPDGTVEYVWRELGRRSRILGDAYPFQLELSRIRRKAKWQEFPLYTTLVLIGTASHHADTRIQDVADVAKLFEKIVACALGEYVGGPALRIGHPRESPAPKAFKDLLAFLSRELGEGLRRADPLIKETKDLRADVIAWRPFSDRNGGQLVVFAQCAIGSNWIGKLSECNVDLWARMIEFVVTPVRAFAVPFVLTEDNKRLEYGTIGGVPLDRVRLAEMLDRASVASETVKQAKDWARAQIKKVPWDD